MNDLQPLELWFKKYDNNTGLRNELESFKTRYFGVRDYFFTKVAPLINLSLAAREGMIFTDHGPEHFKNVIFYVGKLINISPDDEIEEKSLLIKSHEVFFLLIAILLHDMGNIYGRSGHEKKAAQILSELGVLMPDSVENRIIAKIAEAHGGKVEVNGKEEKDTITHLIRKDNDTIGKFSYRPRLLAAILRFADEICEFRGREATFLLENSLLEDRNIIYHDYAHSIVGVTIDKKSKILSISFELSSENIYKIYSKNDNKQYLIDEINERLEKMFCELLYCKRFAHNVISIDIIRANIDIYKTKEDTQPILSERIELKETGYPTKPVLVSSLHPEWKGQIVKNNLETLLKGENLNEI